MKEYSGNLSAQGLRLAVVVSRFNSVFTEQLLQEAEAKEQPTASPQNTSNEAE